MNNNNFSIMRYFRDLGADAHLLLYKGDGANSLSHFKPENDTWDIDQWSSFIHQTDIINGPGSIFGNPERVIWPYQPLCYSKYFIKTLLNRHDRSILPPSKKHLKAIFDGFDVYIGSGLSPAILNRIGLSLDIFYPYETGIEFLGSPSLSVQISSGSHLIRSIFKQVAQAQKNGIRRARYCLNAEMSFTKQAFEKIGVKFLPFAVPMVYNRDLSCEEHLSEELLKLKEKLQKYEFTVVSHARLMWINPGNYTDVQWEQNSKHNDWLIKSFAEFSRERPKIKSLLLLFEYGSDIEHSKKLCFDLGINHMVKWLPMYSRREIMQIISCCKVGVGEFHTNEDVIWGGTGWEVLASGKPLLQSFRFKDGAFESTFGYPAPPMLPVVGPNCIFKHLIDMADHPEKGVAIGKEAAKWFNQYNGIGLAKKWLELILNP